MGCTLEPQPLHLAEPGNEALDRPLPVSLHGTEQASATECDREGMFPAPATAHPLHQTYGAKPIRRLTCLPDADLRQLGEVAAITDRRADAGY